MRLFKIPNGVIDAGSRCQWLTAPFDKSIRSTNIGPGRIEVTMPPSRREFTMFGLMDFTLPKTVGGFTEVQS